MLPQATQLATRDSGLTSVAPTTSSRLRRTYPPDYTSLDTTLSTYHWHTPAGAMSGKLTTDVDKRLLRTTKFPPEFNIKVDMTKVNFPVIKRWVQDEIERILGTEDEVVMNTIFNLVEESRYVSNGWIRLQSGTECAY